MSNNIQSVKSEIALHIEKDEYQQAYEIWKVHKNLIDEKIGFEICHKLGRIISYRHGGRLGNNLFQYFATKLIAYHNDLHYFHYDKVKNMSYIVLDSTTLSDKSLISNLIKNKEKLHIIPNIIYVINDYCQIDYVLLHPLTKCLFTPYNFDIVTETGNVKISDIFINIHKNSKVQFNPDDLVLHLRLSDFNFGQILKPECIMKLLDKLTWNKFYIVCEKVIYNYEIKYLTQFLKYNPIFLQGDLYEDMASMFYAPRLICTNSSLAWLMGSLGFNYISYIPKNIGKISIPEGYPNKIPPEHDKIIWHNYHLHQDVKKININSVNYDSEFQSEIYDKTFYSSAITF
jgi:hypothetical protein